MGAPRVLDPSAECSTDLWPRQQAALNALLGRRKLPFRLAHPRDLATLPFTHKADLQTDSPLTAQGVPVRELVRIHASSGTSGQRTISAYTQHDLSLWTRVVARGLAALGVGTDSVVYSTLAHGLFTGGFGFHQAATRLGATVIPGGQANSHTHADLIRRLRPTVLFATPSYAQHLADRHGPLPPIELGVFGAEPWSEADRQRLQQSWGMTARDTYGLSEIIGPGVAFECPVSDGLHINADHFIPEVVDASGCPLPDGEWGELVLSAPTRQARPLLRYRTGDHTRLMRSPCPCGRTLPRMARVTGRVDDMRVVRGVNVHPAAVAAALAAWPEPHGGWFLELSRPAALDELTCVIELPGPTSEATSARLAQHLREHLGLRLSVRCVPLGSSPHHGGKVSRWKDTRTGQG